MENNNNIKDFERVYQNAKTNNEITKRDKIELIDDFINKMKELIHQGHFIIEAMEKENKY